MAAAAELRAPCSTSWRSPSRSGCRRSGSGVGLADAMSTRSASTAASTKRAAVVEQQGRGAVGGLAQLPREGAVLGQHRGEPLLDGRRGWRRRRERVDDGRELELSSGAGCRPRHGRRCASPPRHGGALRAPPRGKEAAAAAGRIWPPRPAVSRARTGEPAPPRLALRLAAAGTRAGEPAPPRPAAGTRASSAACAGRRGGRGPAMAPQGGEESEGGAWRRRRGCEERHRREGVRAAPARACAGRAGGARRKTEERGEVVAHLSVRERERRG